LLAAWAGLPEGGWGLRYAGRFSLSGWVRCGSLCVVGAVGPRSWAVPLGFQGGRRAGLSSPPAVLAGSCRRPQCADGLPSLVRPQQEGVIARRSLPFCARSAPPRSLQSGRGPAVALQESGLSFFGVCLRECFCWLSQGPLSVWRRPASRLRPQIASFHAFCRLPCRAALPCLLCVCSASCLAGS
jgi:hypothetical protein